MTDEILVLYAGNQEAAKKDFKLFSFTQFEYFLSITETDQVIRTKLIHSILGKFTEKEAVPELASQPNRLLFEKHEGLKNFGPHSKELLNIVLNAMYNDLRPGL